MLTKTGAECGLKRSSPCLLQLNATTAPLLPGHVFETAKGLGVFRASAGEVGLLLLFIFTAKWISGFILEE